MSKKGNITRALFFGYGAICIAAISYFIFYYLPNSEWVNRDYDTNSTIAGIMLFLLLAALAIIFNEIYRYMIYGPRDDEDDDDLIGPAL